MWSVRDELGKDGEGQVYHLQVKCYEAGWGGRVGGAAWQSYFIQTEPFSAEPVDMEAHCVIPSTTYGTEGVS